MWPEPINLKYSCEFLNIVLDSIHSAVFIIDGEGRMRGFNRAFRALFPGRDEELEGRRFGNALGCGFAVDEEVLCGSTSRCSECVIRESYQETLATRKPVFDRKVQRHFKIGKRLLIKYFQFSTRYLNLNGREMVLVILDDITKTEATGIEINRDLKAAAEIQVRLLPSDPPVQSAFDVAWKYLPCRQLGGDIFNVVELPEHLWGFYMLDVSGHGVAAALVAVSVYHTLQKDNGFLVRKTVSESYNSYLMSTKTIEKDEIVPPREVAGMLNAHYSMDTYGNFFSFFYMLVDAKAHEITYCNAGHPHPLILGRNGAVREMESNGPVIGSGFDLNYTERRVMLSRGDRIFLYTDGILEYENENGDAYGKESLLRAIEAAGSRRVGDAVEDIVADVFAFGKGFEPQDDISLLCLEYQGG